MTVTASPTSGVFPDPKDVQGNILSGFLKDHQAFLFFVIRDKTLARQWIGRMAQSQISSQAEVRGYNDLYKLLLQRSSTPEQTVVATWVNIAFTNSGLLALGLDAASLQALEPSLSTSIAQTAATLGDAGPSDPSTWVECFRTEDEVHFLLIIASDSEAQMGVRASNLVDDATNYGLSLVHQETGKARVDLPGHEHFGFLDGVSQPRPQVAATDDPSSDGTSPWQFVVPPVGQPHVSSVPTPGTPGYVPSHTPAQPPPSQAFTANGSYVVFRKLAQDVAGFNRFVESQQILSGISPGTKLVGRYPSGAPVEVTRGLPSLDPTHGDISGAHPELLTSANDNDFDFTNDPSGTNIPRAAHIRKSNIRQGGSLAHIMRRGIAYGEPFRADADPDSPEGVNQERGLLFLCYQASITAQYEFIQTAWVNNANFPQQGDGVDPIIGQASACPLSVPGWAANLPVPRFVNTRASVYMFSPSFTSLRYIATLTS